MEEEPAGSRTSLATVSPEGWDRLIEQVDAAAMVVTLEGWLGPELGRWCTAEDVWQETLLAAWQHRGELQWQGVAAFRRWLLQIARHRLRDLADEKGAAKRGGGRQRRMADLPRPGAGSSAGGSHYAGPYEHTSPDRAALDRERAGIMRRALAGLPAELEPVVRMRLFDDRPVGEIASTLRIGEPAVRYRLRKGLEAYRALMRSAGGAPTGETVAPESD